MKILIVDDDKLSRESIAEFLTEQLAYEVYQVANGSEALAVADLNEFDAVITDVKMPGFSGIELLKKLKNEFPLLNVIIMTGFGNMESVIECLRAGATDYLLKPINVEDLAGILESIKERDGINQRLPQSNKALENKSNKLNADQPSTNQHYLTFSGEVGIFSVVMAQLVELAELYHKNRDIPVVIQGETGTGKEILAQLVHGGKEQTTNAPFIPINCSAISPSLFESELFGYQEGAFTGAQKKGSVGKLEMAQGGTIFLDEIGEMPIEFQPKLLRVLQEKEMYRVGGDKKIKLDVRFVFATNRLLTTMVEQGQFRSDLYFRLNTGSVFIPPLRERKEEIMPLTQFFLEKFAEKYNKPFRFVHPEARKELEAYPWPGNVRELNNIIERVVLLYSDECLRKSHLDLLSKKQKNVMLTLGCPLQTGKIVLPERRFSLPDVENEIVLKALKKFDYNKTKTADFLGISRSALRSRIRRL